MAALKPLVCIHFKLHPSMRRVDRPDGRTRHAQRSAGPRADRAGNPNQPLGITRVLALHSLIDEALELLVPADTGTAADDE